MSGVVGLPENPAPPVMGADIEQDAVAIAKNFLGSVDKCVLILVLGYVWLFFETISQGPSSCQSIDCSLDTGDWINDSRVTDLVDRKDGQLISQRKKLVELDVEGDLLISGGLSLHASVLSDIGPQRVDKLGNSCDTKRGATLFLSGAVNACREYRQACEDGLCPCGTGCPPIEGTARTRNDPKAVVRGFHGALLFVEAAA